MQAFKPLFSVLFLGISAISCNRNTYPCPDIRGGTEVVKAGSTEGLKKVEPDFDSNGNLAKKPYVHPGMKKRKR
jgi:hypothetical protein